MTRDLPTLSLAERRSDERYQRLMEVTRRAARGGYDAVSMRDLARETRLSMTTIYQFCSSKDHLIAEAHLEVMELTRGSMTGHRGRGRSARARVVRHLAEVTDAWERDPLFARTLMRAVYSLDPAVQEVRAWLSGTHAAVMDQLIGDDEVAQRDAVIEVIGEVFDSVTLRWVSGSIGAPEAKRLLERAVRLVLPA